MVFTVELMFFAFCFQYRSEYAFQYQEPEVTVPLPLEQKVAGVSSMSSKETREPAFTHKRKVGLQSAANNQVVQGMKFNEEKMNLVHTKCIVYNDL